MLNPPSSPDTGIVKVTSNLSRDLTDWDIELTIWDCSRKITLDFSVWGGLNARTINARLKKLNKLRKALDLVEDRLNEALEQGKKK